MEKIFSRLGMGDFEFKNIEVYKMPFKNGNTVDYRENGRVKHLLYIITSGERSYEINSECIKLKPDTLILIPEGTKYKTKAHTTLSGECDGIGISFCCENLFMPNEQNLFFKEDLHHIAKIKELFENCASVFTSSPLELLSLKAAVYNLFSYLIGNMEKHSEDYNLIKPALDFLTDNFKENLPVSVYSAKCNLSESYFRKKFTEYMGMSPIEYRNKLRFAEAKRLYCRGFGTQQIAEKLGFCDSGYLLKLYKKRNGITLRNDSGII